MLFGYLQKSQTGLVLGLSTKVVENSSTFFIYSRDILLYTLAAEHNENISAQKNELFLRTLQMCEIQ